MNNEKYFAITERMVKYLESLPDKCQTVKILARRYHTTHATILQMAEDRGLMINIGWAISGTGIHTFETTGDYSVELP